jgi:hypothetical protein
MASLGATTPFKTRFVYALFGLLALFFPGYVVFVLLKSVSIVLKRLSKQEREIVYSMLDISCD